MTTPKILLVDDVKVFLDFERTFFERAGCKVLTARSGTEALRLVRDEKPHIVLLDYEMPGMNGEEVCRAIKKDPSTRHIPVLIVTSHDSTEVLEKCRRAGSTDVVTKPISGRAILQKVVSILEIPCRAQVRTRVAIEVSVAGSGDSLEVLGYSEDISEGGILVETVEPLETGSRVSIAFTLPSGGPLRIDAEVVRVDRTAGRPMFSTALRFLGQDPSFRAAVRSFVMENVGR